MDEILVLIACVLAIATLWLAKRDHGVLPEELRQESWYSMLVCIAWLLCASFAWWLQWRTKGVVIPLAFAAWCVVFFFLTRAMARDAARKLGRKEPTWREIVKRWKSSLLLLMQSLLAITIWGIIVAIAAFFLFGASGVIS